MRRTPALTSDSYPCVWTPLERPRNAPIPGLTIPRCAIGLETKRIPYSLSPIERRPPRILLASTAAPKRRPAPVRPLDQSSTKRSGEESRGEGEKMAGRRIDSLAPHSSRSHLSGPGCDTRNKDAVFTATKGLQCRTFPDEVTSDYRPDRIFQALSSRIKSKRLKSFLATHCSRPPSVY